MQERLKELLNKVIDWWKGLTVRQRTMIVCVGAAVILAFAILGTVLSRPRYTLLKECESASEAAQIKDILDSEGGYTYRISDDGLRVEVGTNQIGDANLLLAANNIVSPRYTIDNVTAGGMGITESDKQKRYVVMLQDELEHDFIGMFDAIKDATVILKIPEANGTLIAKEEESSASIALKIDGDFTSDNAAFLARAVATALGNKSTKNISIIDTSTGNMLYTGEEDYTVTYATNNQMAVKQQSEMVVGSKVKNALLGTNGFDDIQVAVNLAIDFSTKEITDHNYYAPENSTQGLLAEAHIYTSDSTAGPGDVPGTDSNDEPTTYVLDTNGEQSTSVSEEDYKYVPGETITKETVTGIIDYTTSSAAVTAIDYNVITEEDAKRQGLLDAADLNWEEYKAANVGRTRIDVDPDLVNVVAMATGIPAENIAIVAYTENWFVDKDGLNIGASDIIVFVLILLILGLLAFVILRSMMREKAPEEPEEELSVESLLESTPMNEIENIEVEPKSEERLVLEKFVAENPESAANLLRNWLNEDWG